MNNGISEYFSQVSHAVQVNSSLLVNSRRLPRRLHRGQPSRPATRPFISVSRQVSFKHLFSQVFMTDSAAFGYMAREKLRLPVIGRSRPPVDRVRQATQLSTPCDVRIPVGTTVTIATGTSFGRRGRSARRGCWPRRPGKLRARFPKAGCER